MDRTEKKSKYCTSVSSEVLSDNVSQFINWKFLWMIKNNNNNENIKNWLKTDLYSFFWEVSRVDFTVHTQTTFYYDYPLGFVGMRGKCSPSGVAGGRRPPHP